MKSTLTTWLKWVKPCHEGMSLNLEKIKRLSDYKLIRMKKKNLLSSSASTPCPDALRYLSTIGKICFPPMPCESLCMQSYDRISWGSEWATVMNALLKFISDSESIQVQNSFDQIKIIWSNAISLEYFFSLCCIKGLCLSYKFLSFKTSAIWPGFSTIMELILLDMTNWTWFQTHKAMIKAHNTSINDNWYQWNIKRQL